MMKLFCKTCLIVLIVYNPEIINEPGQCPVKTREVQTRMVQEEARKSLLDEKVLIMEILATANLHEGRETRRHKTSEWIQNFLYQS